MGTPKASGSGQQPSPREAVHRSSKQRRNTVHTASTEAASSPSWLPMSVSYGLPQPVLYPLYSPLWHLTQFGGLGQAGVVHNGLPVLPSAASPSQTWALPASRAHSPNPRGRPRARSPEARAEKPRADARANAKLNGSSSPAFQEDAGRPTRRTLDILQPLVVRPTLQHTHSHQSNSVPSTPHQRPRKLSLGASSPAPVDDPTHSPRSVHSESNSHLPPLRRPPVGCRFETPIAFSKRRMPYSLGGDPLEKAKGPIKEALQPDEEQKLTGDMRELYDRLLPSAENEERRAKLVQKLERLLNAQWPGGDIRVRVFGSSGNMLCSSDSDGQSSAPTCQGGR